MVKNTVNPATLLYDFFKLKIVLCLIVEWLTIKES